MNNGLLASKQAGQADRRCEERKSGGCILQPCIPHKNNARTRSRADLLGGLDKRPSDGFFYAAASSSARCTAAGSRSITVM